MKLDKSRLYDIIREELNEFYQDPTVGLYKVDSRGTEVLTGHTGETLDDLQRKVDKEMPDLTWVPDRSYFGGHYEDPTGTVYKVARTKPPSRYSPEDIVKVVFGDIDRPRGKWTLGGFINRMMEKAFFGPTKDERSPLDYQIQFNTKTTVKNLKQIGLSDDQIRQVRRLAIESMKEALQRWESKWGLDKDNYVYDDNEEGSFTKHIFWVSASSGFERARNEDERTVVKSFIDLWKDVRERLTQRLTKTGLVVR